MEPSSGAILGMTNDGKIRFEFQRFLQAITEERMIVYDQDSNRLHGAESLSIIVHAPDAARSR